MSLARKRDEKVIAAAVYKLIEIDQVNYFLSGQLEVDLGAAPGGWSEYAVTRLATAESDRPGLLPVEPVAGMTFIQGDFTEQAVLDEPLTRRWSKGQGCII